MSEREMIMAEGTNPYDHLIEVETEPVKSPVILGNAEVPDKKIKHDTTMEIVPLAGEAAYSKISVKEYRSAETVHVDVEEDLLVPDTFPDMEMILNVDARVLSGEIFIENETSEIKGRIKLETMYRTGENYGNNISVLPAELNFTEILKCDGAVHLNPQISKIEYRIVNERKYKIRVMIEIDVKCEREKEHLIFEGIDGETLHLKKKQLCLMDLLSRKISESDVSEELLINDEKIRPVKILKYKVNVAENHRQLTKEKLVLNQTLWIRVMYLAEIASKGNLSNQVMFFRGKVDHTQFISLGKMEGETESCITASSAENIKVDINRESNGFEISGEIATEIACYGYMERELVADFYHSKEEMTCDRKTENVCAGVERISVEQTIRESIGLQQESGDELRIIYLDAQPFDVTVAAEESAAVVRGKLHMEAVVMNEGDYTILAKKICDFSCIKELPQEKNCVLELSGFTVRELTGDIAGTDINLTAQIQADINIFKEAEFTHISNPCIVKSSKPEKCYPITIHTVSEGESVWDIGKKYKVSEECIMHYNKEDSIKAGNKIIIVK